MDKGAGEAVLEPAAPAKVSGTGVDDVERDLIAAEAGGLAMTDAHPR